MEQIKERKHYYLSQKSISYINDLKKENNDRNNSVTLERIINEHKNEIHLTQKDTINLISEEIFLITKKYLGEEIKKIKLGINRIDFDTKVMLEVINGLLILKNIDELPLTKELESNVLLKAKKSTKDNMINSKYKNDGKLY